MVILAILASPSNALAQNALAQNALAQNALAQQAAPPTAPWAEAESTLDCASDRPVHAVTDADITLSPSRGWQMVGRAIEVTITSTNLPPDARPVVCFSWKFKDGTRSFVPADAIQIVQQSPETRQPVPKPPTLRFAVPVPSIKSPGVDPDAPYKNAVEYSPYDQYAPVAEVRTLVLGRDNRLIDVVAPVAVVRDQNYCNVPIGRGVGLESGTIEPSASKNWQPVGGEIEFTVKGARTFASDALIKVCFRWKLNEGIHSEFNESGPVRILDYQPGVRPSVIKLAVGVPELWDKQPGRGWLRSGDDTRIGSYALWGMVPETDVRTLVFDKDLNPALDTAGKIGVTNTGLAALLAAFALAVAFALLHWACRQRFPDIGNPLLCMITTPRGFASLSRFQILLWTFVVMASSIYAIALAGDLIVITPGTLILLGISGAAAVLAKVKASGSAEPAASAALPASAGQAATPEATVQTEAADGHARQPRWSDLIMDEVRGQELDVTRVQMLVFTLVTAAFVIIKVMTSTKYEIPDIPPGFLILMGISNGVYVSSKFATQS